MLFIMDHGKSYRIALLKVSIRVIQLMEENY